MTRRARGREKRRRRDRERRRVLSARRTTRLRETARILSAWRATRPRFAPAPDLFREAAALLQCIARAARGVGAERRDRVARVALVVDRVHETLREALRRRRRAAEQRAGRRAREEVKVLSRRRGEAQLLADERAARHRRERRAGLAVHLRRRRCRLLGVLGRERVTLCLRLDLDADVLFVVVVLAVDRVVRWLARAVEVVRPVLELAAAVALAPRRRDRVGFGRERPGRSLGRALPVELGLRHLGPR